MKVFRSALLVLLASAAWAQTPNDNLVVSPAHNWVLPIFTPEGYRSLLLRGDEVRLRRDDRVDIDGVNIALFRGDASNQVTTIILSPEASYFPKMNRAGGPTLVRVLHSADGAELTGADWTYDFSRDRRGIEQKLTIRRNVRVVLQQSLADFLQ